MVTFHRFVSSGRTPGEPDDNEFIVIRPDQPLTQTENR
jgi:hypothetical protein